MFSVYWGCIGIMEKKLESYSGFRVLVFLQEIEYGVYGDLITIYPKPYSI